nr:cystinosin homolog [Onthophagus taurus]
MSYKTSLLIFLCFLTCISSYEGFDQKIHNILVTTSKDIAYIPEIPDKHDNVTIYFLVENLSLIRVNPESLDVNSQDPVLLTVKGLHPGKSDVITRILSNYNNTVSNISGGFTIINVHKSDLIVSLSEVIGWMYFFAWSMSFYPQVWTNYHRKSVVGLNFDFVSLNFVGFLCYSIFNVGLYAIPVIREQYSARYPTSVITILIQDIVFALHGLLLTIVYCVQCMIYERRSQRISIIGKGFHSIFATIFIVALILANFNYMSWLDFMYACSYIKLSITITKYFPQVYMNYKRKSTVGWNIYNILWDLGGGILSILQMGLNAYNYDEWEGLIENPTKFWLGVLTIVFDVVFILQHYGFYRHREDANPESETMLNDEKFFISKTSVYSKTNLQTI